MFWNEPTSDEVYGLGMWSLLGSEQNTVQCRRKKRQFSKLAVFLSKASPDERWSTFVAMWANESGEFLPLIHLLWLKFMYLFWICNATMPLCFCCLFWHCVSTGSPSRGEDVAEPSLPTAFYYVFVSVSVFINCASFHTFFRQLSAFSLCSSGLISALVVLSTIYLFMKVSFSPDIILCGWLGLKLKLTN